MDGFAKIRRALHGVIAVLHKEIPTGATRSTAGVLKDPIVIDRNDASGPIQVDKNTVGIPPRNTNQVLTGTGPYAPPINIGGQKIEGPRRSIIPQEAGKSEPIDASINQFSAEHRDPTPGWSKIIGSKVVTNKISDFNACR